MTELSIQQTENKKMLGLSQKEAERQRTLGNVNVQPDPTAKTNKEIIRENVFTYFNLIFLILAILCIVAGSFNSLSFLPVIVANTLIGIVQELHAKKILDDLSLLNEPTALVLRDGKKIELPTTELVLGDVIFLKSGNQIPADAVVVHGEVSVNEALLTGEADEIEKKEKAELMSGSFVVSGECYARLTRVGEASYISQLLLKAKQEKSGEQSEMIRSINRLVIVAGVIIIPVGLAMFYQGYFVQGESFRDTVTSMVAALIGMIPEGMYLLVSVALAVSAALLARKKVMLHDMKSTETLARVDVLCVDKTGTVTDNSMLVADIVPVGELREGDDEKYRLILQKYIWAIPDDNLTMQALRDYAPSLGKEECKAFIPFSSKYKYGSVTFDEDGQFLLGAPEAVLGIQYDLYKKKIEEYAGKGLRVMVFAKYAGKLPLDEGAKLLPQQRTLPLYFILLQNPLRENAVKVFSYFAEQGVKVKVISGDHALTVSEVAKQAHIPGAEKYVDATTLKTDDDIMRAAVKYNVFGRTTPEQKQKLIRALKKHGHTVAMTGDGVNDILAMKSADCSVAMAAGSDAAAQAAQVVLLDSDFAHMPQIVSEGRKTINNLQRSSTLFLVKNIFSLLLAIFSIINVATYPLVPSQITLISLFNIGIPAFFLAAEPNDHPIKGRFFVTVLIKSMPAALTNFLVIAALMVFGMTFNVSQSDISVAATFLMAIVGFMILYNLSQPMNKYHWGILGGCILGFAFCAYFFHSLFSISNISVECIMLFVLFAIATEPLMRYLTRLFEFFGRLISGEHKLTRKKKKMQRDLTEGSVLKNLLIFAVPYFIATFLQSFYGLVDLFVVGRFNGAEVISAVSSGSQVMHMVTVTIVGFAMGATVLIGRMVGEKNTEGRSRAIGTTITIFLLLAILLTAFLLLNLNHILSWLSVPEEAWSQTADYLRVCFMGVPAIVFYNVASSIFRGLGDTKTPMYFVAVSGLLNILLDFILIGPFHMGAEGAAIATVAAQILSVFLAFFSLLRPKRGLGIHRKDLAPRGELLSAILKVGLPIAAQEFLIQISFLVITAIANDRGVVASASVGIVEKIISFLFLFQSAMLSAVSTLTAQNIGANKHEQGEKALKYGVFLGMGYACCVILICEIFAEGLIGLFTTGEPEVVLMGSQYLRSYVIDALFVSIHFCFSGYFTAYGKSLLSFLQNLAAIILLRIPGAYLASMLFPQTLFPMGLAAPAGSLLSAVICLVAYFKFHKKWI